MKNIYLTGIMGCGKTAIGKRFAEEAGKFFFDTDDMVEHSSGCTVKNIFQNFGEAEFRARESAALARVSKREGAVVSCGGGIVLDPANVSLMKETGTVIYIYRDIDDILTTLKTDTRPLLADDGSNLRALFEQRRVIYEGACDVTLVNDKTPERAVARLAALVGFSLPR